MDDGPILDIDPVTDTYRIDISSHHCTPPYRTIIAHDDITDDDSVVSEEAILTKCWVDVVNRTDNGHLKFTIEDLQWQIYNFEY